MVSSPTPVKSLKLSMIFPLAFMSTSNFQASPFDFTSERWVESVLFSPFHFFLGPLSWVPVWTVTTVSCLPTATCFFLQSILCILARAIKNRLGHVTLLFKSPATFNIPQNKMKIPYHDLQYPASSSPCLPLWAHPSYISFLSVPWIHQTLSFLRDLVWAVSFFWKCSSLSTIGMVQPLIFQGSI